MNRITALIKRDMRGLASSLYFPWYEDTQEGAMCKVGSGLPPKNHEKQMLVAEPLSLWYFCYSSQNWLRQAHNPQSVPQTCFRERPILGLHTETGEHTYQCIQRRKDVNHISGFGTSTPWYFIAKPGRPANTDGRPRQGLVSYLEIEFPFLAFIHHLTSVPHMLNCFLILRWTEPSIHILFCVWDHTYLGKIKRKR